MAPSPLNPLTIASDLHALSPMAIRDLHLAKREAYAVNPAEGAKDPHSFNNVGVQFAFAFIGLTMTLGALWFFFWAKNGGFKWRENDWEDYKSTVLRRKGPDGKTLSNATKSTKLGGGSVVHGGSYGVESSVGYTDETGTSADITEMREAEEGKGRRAFGIRGGDGKHDEKKKRSRPKHDNNYRDPELREYRQERPARVGGINREADGMYSDFASQPSELGSNVSSRPLIKDKGKDKEKPKDKKQEAKEKERRAKERMRKAKLAEKEALKTAAAEAKAQKEAEKAAAKKEKEEKKKAKKSRRTETEATPSEAPAMTEYTAPMTEYTAPSEAAGPSAPRRAPPSAAYSFVTGDDQTVYTGVYTDNPSTTRTAPSEGLPESSYYSDYRPNADPSAHPSRSRNQSRTRESRTRPTGSRPNSQSPRKQHRTSRQSAAPSDIFTAANGDVQGTISYPCHIPGLSSAGSVGVSESVSQVGGPSHARKQQRDVMAGYRRGGVRTVRRDSLSDSDA
ncbi:hypothetical protein K458DRAFT_420460 [Lentithecium fluviatile CBS 122367]|uniref:Uncharacterized protein n=1 Tax=Lentithecium fluviatile CBS 122367 TaxID=1168545 RepID=A0A6G1IUS6_9PLEO|nr:hypothetical protein K458DRAFT_420460 [Lentithecium fluviatile CBS 122367]